MNEIQIFKKQEFGEIRSLEINGEPYFVAKDVCEILEIKNPTQAVNRLDKDERTMFNIGRQGETNLVNEYGLYNLIIASRKKEAKAFKRWITHEVIPSIRKHGAFLTENKIEEVLSNPDTIIKLATDLKRERAEREKLQLENTQNRQIIGELKPKADYTDRILKSKTTVTVTAIAKDYGMSAVEFNKVLHDLKIQFKQSGQWFLYEKYQKCGYTHSKTTEYIRKDGSVGSNLNTEWTQKGRLFLYNKLKEHNIIPIIEKE